MPTYCWPPDAASNKRHLHPVLQLREPEKYKFNPKELLVTICSVYLSLDVADKAGVLATAIAADGRSYRPEMFAEAAAVLRQFALLPESDVQRLERLGERAAAAAAQGAFRLCCDAHGCFLNCIMSTAISVPTCSVSDCCKHLSHHNFMRVSVHRRGGRRGAVRGCPRPLPRPHHVHHHAGPGDAAHQRLRHGPGNYHEVEKRNRVEHCSLVVNIH